MRGRIENNQLVTIAAVDVRDESRLTAL